MPMSPSSRIIPEKVALSSGEAIQASTPPVTRRTSSGNGNPNPQRSSTPKTKAYPTPREWACIMSTSRSSIRDSGPGAPG